MKFIPLVLLSAAVSACATTGEKSQVAPKQLTPAQYFATNFKEPVRVPMSQVLDLKHRITDPMRDYCHSTGGRFAGVEGFTDTKVRYYRCDKGEGTWYSQTSADRIDTGSQWVWYNTVKLADNDVVEQEIALKAPTLEK